MFKFSYLFIFYFLFVCRFPFYILDNLSSGGALTQAKSSLSSWFSNWKSSNDKEAKDTKEAQS